MHRQPSPYQGSRYRRRAETRRLSAAGSRQRAAAAAGHHRGSVDAGQGQGGGIDGCDRCPGAQADRTRRAGAGCHPSGAGGRCDREHRVLHGNGAERAHRSLVHAGQRRDVHQDAGGGNAVARPEHRPLEQRRRQHAQARSGRNRRSGSNLARPRGHPSLDHRRGRAGTHRSAIRRAVHRGGQGGDHLDSEKLPAMGPKSHGFGSAGAHAPQLSYLERQRPHGWRPLDRRVWLVDRKSIESDHGQDAVAHARDDGAAAQRGRRSAAVGGTAGNRAPQPGTHRGADGARFRLCRRPRSGADQRDFGARGQHVGNRRGAVLGRSGAERRAAGCRRAAADGPRAA